MANQITRDWNRLFPGLGVYKSMRLVRRVGPILQGICLERRPVADDYRPVSHVHCLCSDIETVTFGMPQYLLSRRHSVPERIETKWHASKYEEAAERLRNASLLPFAGPLKLWDVIAAYRQYDTLGDPSSKCSVSFQEEIILILAWSDRTTEACDAIEEAVEMIKGWPPHVQERIGVGSPGTELEFAL